MKIVVCHAGRVQRHSKPTAMSTNNDSVVAAQCVTRYMRDESLGHCRCLTPADNVSASLESALERQQPRFTRGRATSGGGTGGLAVLLRGGAYRGSADVQMSERFAAQHACSRSVMRRLVRPYADAGVRVHIFIAVYDNLNSTTIAHLTAPYASHLAGVIRLAASASEQVTATANALRSFLVHCEEAAETYDAVVLTRFDLHFKADLRPLLGEELSSIHGVRFLWRELEDGTRWRLIWKPSDAMVQKASEKQRAEYGADHEHGHGHGHACMSRRGFKLRLLFTRSRTHARQVDPPRGADGSQAERHLQPAALAS